MTGGQGNWIIGLLAANLVVGVLLLDGLTRFVRMWLRERGYDV